jgi:hypothetical protein
VALEAPAFVISASSHSAALFRQASQLFIDGAGVAEPSGLAVTQNGVANMSVNVAAGTLWMPGTLGATTGFGSNVNAQTAYGLPSSKTAQGMYAAYQDGTVNLSISAADPTNPRIDIVTAAVQDAQYAGSTNLPVLQIITGTPNASPSAPSAPASSVVLAQVAVAAGVTSIVTANITDVRPMLSVRSSVTRTSGTAQYPTHPITGQYVDDAYLNALLRWTGSAWVPPSPQTYLHTDTIVSGPPAVTTGVNGVTSGLALPTLPYATLLKVSALCYIHQATSTDVCEAIVQQNSSTVMAADMTGSYASPSMHKVFAVAAGVSPGTWQLLLSKISGSGSSATVVDNERTWLQISVEAA